MKPIALPCPGLAKVLLLSLILQCSLISAALPYQTVSITVSGTVTSLADGQSLPGVTVVVKGTNTGSVTDIDGKYTIEVPNATDVLVFSSIGYLAQEVPVNNRSLINIIMEEDIANLEEVVVVGYGTQRKSDLTGAVASIKSDKLLDRQAFSVSQALQGRLPGVDVYANTAAPGEPARIRIRCINSINSGVDPLFVVDGVIGINVNFLDPNNIESVEVLKHA